MQVDRDTRNFNIKVEDAETDENGDLRARVYAKPLGREEQHHEERIKLSGHSTSRFASDVQDMFDLDEEDKKNLKIEILKLKNEVKEQATPANQNNSSQEPDREQLEEKFHEMMQNLMAAGDTLEQDALESALDIDNALHIIDEIDPDMSLVFTEGEDKITITDEGKQKVKEYMGFETFDGDPEAEAQKQLREGNPLRYYLDSFNKVHKGDHLLKVWELVSALSCSCADRQIHSWAVGPSGKGKSHLKRCLLDFLPNEMYKRKESFSPKALQYKSHDDGAGFLNNKLVYFDEVGEDDVDNAIELMRLMTDQDQDVVTHETVKDQEILTITLDVSDITVWFTSVETIEDEQLKNRFILTNPDASSAQDETVNQHQQDILNKGGDLDFIPKEAPVIQAMIRDIRMHTPDYKPVVPFKINWKQQFNRRLYPFFYTLMGMIAKIHYKNRKTQNGYIFVTKADFELAKLIWSRLIDTTVAQTDEQSIKLLKELPENREDAATRQDLRLRLSGFSTNKVKETCEKLEETEELQLINTVYEEGMYKHWAGADVQKLVDNKPEIRDFNKEVVVGMIKEAGLEPDDEILENIFESEIKVYDYLKECVEEQKAVKEEENDNSLDLELSEEEEYLLKQFTEFEWGIDLNSIRQYQEQQDNPEVELDVLEAAESLEEKDVIRIDGENMPSPKTNFDKLKAEGEVSI